jgi:PAS domain-containing protein
MLWVMAHTPSCQFDAEDERLLTGISRFAAVAYQMRTALVTTDAGLKAKADEVRQILGAAAIGLTHCSRDLRYLACNREYEKLAGLSADQIIGRAIIDVMGSKAFEVIRPYIEPCCAASAASTKRRSLLRLADPGPSMSSTSRGLITMPG